MELKELITEELKNDRTGRKIEKIIFNIILKHIKDMVFIMKVEEGPQFRYLFVNQAGAVFTNTMDQMIGKTIEEVLPFDRASALQQAYESVLSSNSVQTYSDELKLPGGETLYSQSVLTPVRDENDAIRYIVSVTRDITDEINEKKRLMLTEQRYRSIVDHNLDGIFAISFDSKIIEVNPAGQKLAGYSEKQMTHRSIYDLVAEGDHSKFKELFESTISGVALETLDCRFVHSKGHFITVHIRTVPIVIDHEIKGIYIITRDISEQAKNAETVKYMAFHDQLTGLFNRRALLNDLEEKIKRNENKEPFALLSIDLDRFKYLNDTLGHLAGDQILIKVGERLTEDRKQNFKVYRQGGDEFIILLEGNRRDATRLAQDILSKFSKSFYLHSDEYYISPSIGISTYPSDGKNAEALIKNADEALYRVKEKGKAHFQFYRTEMKSLFTNVVSLETQLRKALDRNELILYYQPQVELQTGKITSFEALLRWNSSEYGMVSPADFIPLAEDTGLIIPIGNWVIETACKQIRDWNKQEGNKIKVAINISPKQFQYSLVETIKMALEKYKIQPSLLEIEITEGAMHDTSETAPILKGLKELGVAISIDDFGTGYSSLNYIKQFPIDVLKIDQSFIRDVHNNEKDAAITTTIIHLANSLGMEVIAEGIETKEQADFLINSKCFKGQGYFYSRPISAEELEEKKIV
ncbi:putative bifunctional diguanylate cyclase/phosphodiesterase [Cytobacillus sp. FJAT-54145]|uniref:Bifunctional diguanylate cyclase/phosphodiesterase n=1 Tax=Cytobacillus spartinae TaxID=3299023 RepID=A0ABW6KH85_9BACI